MTIIRASFVSLCLLALAGCQSMQGAFKGDYYYSPAAAYALNLTVNTFRGQVVIDERCNQTGGSTTFWDGHGRMFRIDYLDVRHNSLVNAPRFASDMTLFNLVLNNYLRDRLAKSPVITRVEAVHREFLDSTTPKSVFAVAKIVVDSDKATAGQPIKSGTYYYGFLLFKKGDIVYAVQHRQRIYAPDNMKALLLKLAGAMDIPGKVLAPSDLDRMRHMLSKMAPGDSVSPIHMCALNKD